MLLHRLCLAMPFLLSLIAAAQAGDDPLRNHSWQGFYLGGNVGYGNARASADYSVLGVPVISAAETLDGAVYGGQVGYNAQWGRLVLGVETDMMLTGQKANAVRLCVSALCGLTGMTQSSEDSISWLGTARVRAGISFGRGLLYGTGGIGYGAFKSTQTFTTLLATVTSVTEETRPAWVAGAGFETALTEHWSVRFEYLYLDTGSFATSYSLAGLGLITSQNRMTEEIARFGVNYRF